MNHFSTSKKNQNLEMTIMPLNALDLTTTFPTTASLPSQNLQKKDPKNNKNSFKIKENTDLDDSISLGKKASRKMDSLSEKNNLNDEF